MVSSVACIRSVERRDVPSLRALIERAYRNPTAFAGWSREGETPAVERISEAALLQLVAQPTCRLSAAVVDDRLVGSALVKAETSDCCSIGLLAVEPEVQGQGHGDRLLRHAEDVAARTFAAGRAQLEVLAHQARLIRYYERRGYSRTGLSRPYPHRLTRPAKFLLLEKRLCVDRSPQAIRPAAVREQGNGAQKGTGAMQLSS